MSMRRKSERNKAKATPEKKVEKPTRKSTRRRGKRSPSTSPEKDNVEGTAASGICTKETEKSQVQTRLQNKELEQVSDSHEEKVSSTEGDIKARSPEAEEDNNGDSVWKVARADASPGEIQKLKLCRQRNTSEASSDASLSRKKSNKWQESGEGGAGEVDSADEQLVSCTRMSSGIEQPYDPSSSYPGQDSNEEVSDSKEILPETTSANLSDDKPNIDRQGDSNEASCSNQNLHSEPGKPSSTTTAPAPNSNGDHVSEEMVALVIIPKEEQPEEIVEQKPTEVFKKEASVENACKEASTDDEEEEEEEEEDDKRKIHKSDLSSESNDEKHTEIDCSTNRTASCASRRKHRNKYRDSSNSETPDSEDEQPAERKIEESSAHEEKSNAIDMCEEKNKSKSPEAKSNPLLNNINVEVEHSEIIIPKVENETEKQEHVPSADLQVQASMQKPAKVNLKRSFSTRILADKNDFKKDDNDPNANSNESNNQTKENHSNEDNEFKSVPRKRRWGTALSTDSAPSFSISTDSLKALVPGAKPLSINEVRLSKDDDDERDQKNNEKWLNDDINDQKPKDILAQKNGAAKKGDGKVDNHIGVAARRKISIVKEPPHVKSPSPPATKPTNILLIKNLVRPFTLNQIKELLSRTGTIVENGFWMDRIKSKCFVEYSNEDQAFETRQALHGISWPVSNPKRLNVEYATKDDMELARELSKDQPVSRKTEQLLTTDSWQQDWNREERTNSAKVVVVREWDLGKEDGQQHVKEKERDKKEQDKKRRRSRSPALEAHLPAPARKFKKKEDDPPPAKLLDDLFRKTKATPCIYWLPLTNEQIVVKEEMRRQHMAEHARRLEEMRRTERSRDSRRRRSPRK